MIICPSLVVDTVAETQNQAILQNYLFRNFRSILKPTSFPQCRLSSFASYSRSRFSLLVMFSFCPTILAVAELTYLVAEISTVRSRKLSMSLRPLSLTPFVDTIPLALPNNQYTPHIFRIQTFSATPVITQIRVLAPSSSVLLLCEWNLGSALIIIITSISSGQLMLCFDSSDGGRA